MMTPQEVANCTFAKSMMGGYNMASVDDFLDKLTEDYSALFKENAALKAKLKVTVDKMAEYRESEDAIRNTLLAAQKMASSMVTEAEQKRDALIAEATRAAKARKAAIEQEVASEEHRLDEVRARVDRELKAERLRLSVGQERLRGFIQDVTAVCNGQLALLEQLPELPTEPNPQAAAIIQAAAAGTQAADDQPSAAPQAVAAMAVVDGDGEAAPQDHADSPVDDEAAEVERNLKNVLSAFAPAKEDGSGLPEGDPFADAGADSEDLDATRVMNLEDLQFGRNYTRD